MENSLTVIVFLYPRFCSALEQSGDTILCDLRLKPKFLNCDQREHRLDLCSEKKGLSV